MGKKNTKNENANENVSKDRSAFMHSKYEQSARLAAVAMPLQNINAEGKKWRHKLCNFAVFFRQLYIVWMLLVSCFPL